MRLNAMGRSVYTQSHILHEGVIVTELKRNSYGPYILWHDPLGGGCHDMYLELMEGPW